MDDQWPLDLELPAIDQVAFVVRDLEAALGNYAEILGVQPWTVYHYKPPELTDSTYRGEPAAFEMLLATASVGDTMLEVIQPTVGPTIYDEHLNAHGEGMHHLAYFGWDEETTYHVVEQLEAAGMPVIQSGTYQGSEFWYFDTVDELNGLIFETGIPRNREEREPAYVYPDDASSDQRPPD